MAESDEMTCPKCQSPMEARDVGEVVVSRCTSCQGIFLDRADLGALVEAESDFHVDAGPTTQPLPRITSDMTAPPPMTTTSRSYIRTLFQG